MGQSPTDCNDLWQNFEICVGSLICLARTRATEFRISFLYSLIWSSQSGSELGLTKRLNRESDIRIFSIANNKYCQQQKSALERCIALIVVLVFRVISTTFLTICITLNGLGVNVSSICTAASYRYWIVVFCWRAGCTIMKLQRTLGIVSNLHVSNFSYYDPIDCLFWMCPAIS